MPWNAVQRNFFFSLNATALLWWTDADNLLFIQGEVNTSIINQDPNIPQKLCMHFWEEVAFQGSNPMHLDFWQRGFLGTLGKYLVNSWNTEVKGRWQRDLWQPSIWCEIHGVSYIKSGQPFCWKRKCLAENKRVLTNNPSFLYTEISSIHIEVNTVNLM